MDEQLNKYFADELSPEEKAQVFDQINVDEGRKKEYARIQIAVALSSMTHQKGDETWSATKMDELQERIRMKKFRTLSLFILRYVAVAVVAIIGTWSAFMLYSGTHNMAGTLIDVPKGQRVHITLADGTEAWLSSRSQVRIPNQFNKENRIIELDGEGYFSVTKDVKHPFIVQTSQYDVKVLGTKFYVFAYSESPRFEANLVEGSVCVYGRGDEENSIILSPNEKVYLENNRLIKADYVFNNEEYLKNGVFSFTGVPFSQILNYLSLWYNVKFEWKDTVSLNHKVSGKFRRTDEVKDILEALQGVYPFNYKLENDSLITIH